jgi:hypothetical protein
MMIVHWPWHPAFRQWIGDHAQGGVLGVGFVAVATTPSAIDVCGHHVVLDTHRLADGFETGANRLSYPRMSLYHAVFSLQCALSLQLALRILTLALSQRLVFSFQ